MSDTEIIFQVGEAAEGGYVARALGHSIFTEGETRERLRVAVRDAVHAHFELAVRPRTIRLRYVQVESLHLDGRPDVR